MIRMLSNKTFGTFLRLNRCTLYDQKKCFSRTSGLCSFYERDHRGAEYPHVLDDVWEKVVKPSPKAFVQECKKFYQEVKDHFQQDRKLYVHGDTDVFWRFDSEYVGTFFHKQHFIKNCFRAISDKLACAIIDCLKNWRVTSDKVHKEGNSECKLIMNDKKKAVFYGNVDLSLPKDGKNSFAGYCGIKSMKKMKSFFREDCYEFEPFTHLELRVKGDGRNYVVNLGTGMYFDVHWFNTYTYAVYTHGGPYWQVIRIPFSKFFLTSKGRVQDQQAPVPLNKIDSVGITCAGVAGPFRLEIDYIGCHVDWRYKEKCAYEMYKIPKEYVSY